MKDLLYRNNILKKLLRVILGDGLPYFSSGQPKRRLIGAKKELKEIALGWSIFTHFGNFC